MDIQAIKNRAAYAKFNPKLMLKLLLAVLLFVPYGLAMGFGLFGKCVRYAVAACAEGWQDGYGNRSKRQE